MTLARRVGRYELVREIGRGGMGVVFLARAGDGSVVALKLLLRAVPEKLARFDREARLVAKLGESQGFVPLIESGTSEHGPFLAFPFVPGGTLRDRLTRG